MTKSEHIKKLQKYNANQAEYIDQLKNMLDRWVEIGKELTEYMTDEQVAECAIMIEKYKKL